LFIPRKHWEKV